MMIYFDLETGGVEMRHPVIQLAAVAMDGETEVSAFAQRIAFKVDECDPEALKMNHYTPEAWKDATPRAAIAGKFSAWLRPFCTVQKVSKAGNPYSVARLSGYNALTFDLPRLTALYGTQFFPCDYLVRDVLQRALFWFDEHPDAPKPDNFKMATVAEAFGLSTDGAHDALADARMCAALAQQMREVD